MKVRCNLMHDILFNVRQGERYEVALSALLAALGEKPSLPLSHSGD